jgi:ATP/maltotriose-dependent transcriptional regulator MalT
LAIFAGGWWEDAVIPVCADHQLTAGMVPYALAGLVEKSFVVCDHTGLYGLASPIRRFALAQLSALDDQEALRQRHSAHYLRTVGRHVDLLSGPERQQSIVRLISDWQNVQAILRRAIKTRDSETALRIGAAICHVYRVAGYVSEGRSWLQVVLSISRQAPERLRALRARVLHGAGELAHLDGDNVHATSLHIEALALSRALDDRRMMAAALISLATIARYAGDTATSAARYSDAVSDLEAAGDARELARALEMLAALREDEGSFRQAMALHGRARVLYEDLGDTRAATRSLGRMGADALPLGDYAQASQLLEEALLLSRQLGDEVASNDALLRLARLALAQGDTAMAETFLEEAQVLGGKLGAQDGMGIALRGLARVALLRGDLDAAKTLCEISEAVARELGATRDIAQAVLCRADITRASGNLAVAFVTYKESLASLHPVWERPDIGRGLVGMAAAALGLGDAHTAAQLLGMVAALQVHTEVQIEPDAAAEQRVLLSQTRAALGNAVTPPYEASRQLSLSAILAAAEGLRIEGRQAPARTNRDLSGRPLSTRERQIADLVAGGHSNHQIAELLDIAPRTVDSLVGRIFKKLEINDRRDLATRFASQAEG